MWILSRVFGGRLDVGGILGSAPFGAAKDITVLAKGGAAGGGLIIGRSDRGKLVRYDREAHLLAIAPTRSGKGVGTTIRNLLTARRSIVCIDPKARMRAWQDARRAEGVEIKYSMVGLPRFGCGSWKFAPAAATAQASRAPGGAGLLIFSFPAGPPNTAAVALSRTRRTFSPCPCKRDFG